jgi:rhodanese-related sulfurtransferase
MSAASASISPREIELLLQAGTDYELIDVRTPAEFRAAHAEPARNIPLEQLRGDQLRDLVQRSPRRPVLVICQSGARGQRACQTLCSAGAENVRNVAGGTAAWEAAGLPMVRGSGVISLERQVRIGAGALALLGVVLGYWVHPAWLGLAALAGGGLIFAGVTGFCGMANLLAKMPWNHC